jgi:glutathione S-transferase
VKLFDAHVAPNPRRVRMFLAEKEIELKTVQVDIGGGENRRPEFLAMNPLGKVPVLELDDGRYVAESLAICEYFEELQPEPSLFGTDPVERATVRMWERRMELEVMRWMTGAFINSSEFFKGRVTQVPAYADVCRELMLERLTWLDHELSARDHVAGERFSVADITLFCTLDFANMVGEQYDADRFPAVARWHHRVAARPSAAA